MERRVLLMQLQNIYALEMARWILDTRRETLQLQLKHRVRCYTSLKAITGYPIRSGVWRKWHPGII